MNRNMIILVFITGYVSCLGSVAYGCTELQINIPQTILCFDMEEEQYITASVVPGTGSANPNAWDYSANGLSVQEISKTK